MLDFNRSGTILPVEFRAHPARDEGSWRRRTSHDSHLFEEQESGGRGVRWPRPCRGSGDLGGREDVLFLRVHGSTPLRTVQSYRHVGGELTATGATARDEGHGGGFSAGSAGAGREALLLAETLDGILREPRAKRLSQRSGGLAAVDRHTHGETGGRVGAEFAAGDWIEAVQPKERTRDAQVRKSGEQGSVSMQMQARRLTYFPSVAQRHLRRNECCYKNQGEEPMSGREPCCATWPFCGPWLRHVCRSSLTRERGRHGQEKRSTKE